MVSYVINAFENGLDVHAIYTDFSKAFDTVNHSVPLHKLYVYGVHDPLFSWLRSYILDRTQCVFLNGSKSAHYDVTSGVPQGSVIGPFLFNVFINDICFPIKCHKLLYVDDLKIFKSIRSQNDIVRLQSDVTLVENWSSNNGMALNKISVG